jgi:hypothetical protein
MAVPLVNDNLTSPNRRGPRTWTKIDLTPLAAPLPDVSTASAVIVTTREPELRLTDGVLSVRSVICGATVSAGGAQRLAALAGVAAQSGARIAAAATPVAAIRRCHALLAAIEDSLVARSMAHYGAAITR